MRISLGICLLMLGAGCAHSPGKALATSGARPSEQAEQSYRALNFPACTEQFRQAAESAPEGEERAEFFYRAAGCSALAGQSSQALELLKRSAQSGYFDPDHLRLNPELASLHSQAGWQEVVAGVEANRSKAPNPPMPVGVLTAIDVYGSRRADTEAVRRALGLEVGKPIVPSRAIYRQQEEALRKQFPLAFAKVSFIYFFAGEDQGRAFITVDLVDSEDAQRLRFLPAPTGHFEDPEGLIAQWQEYETRSFQLMEKGQLDPEKSSCRVAHCILGFGHPELAPFEPRFVEKVPVVQDALTQVLREDASSDRRATAAFLLAYTATPEETVARLVPSIRDPEGDVRNNVLRVLTATQEKADRPLVELATVVDALSMPETSDRNKSLYLLKMLLEDLKPEALQAQRAPLIHQFGSQLVDMASLQQPIIREPATEVLQLLSGEKYESPEQWKAWLARQGS